MSPLLNLSQNVLVAKPLSTLSAIETTAGLMASGLAGRTQENVYPAQATFGQSPLSRASLVYRVNLEG
jgi:hypothetical protein